MTREFMNNNRCFSCHCDDLSTHVLCSNWLSRDYGYCSDCSQSMNDSIRWIGYNSVLYSLDNYLILRIMED